MTQLAVRRFELHLASEGRLATPLVLAVLCAEWLVVAVTLLRSSKRLRDGVLLALISVAFVELIRTGLEVALFDVPLLSLPFSFFVLQLAVSTAALIRVLQPVALPVEAAEVAQLKVTLANTSAAEEQLRLAFKATGDFIWETDLSTGTLSGSPAIASWLGYPAEAWPPRPWHRIVHPDDRERVLAGVAEVVSNPSARYEARHRLIGFDGTTVHHVRSTGVVTSDASGKPARFVGAVRDITYEVEAEAHRLQAQKLESLGFLAGGIAHDFNGVLTVISASVEVASRTSNDESLSTAKLAIERAAGLTRRLLAYTGRSPTSYKAVDLNELIKSMGQAFAVVLPKRVRLDQHLSAQPMLVNADEAQLHQVVTCLLTNAAEAIGDKDGVVQLTTSLEAPANVRPALVGVAPKGPMVRLAVKDDGCGIAAEAFTRLFDPFFSTKGAGRGLGLAALAGILKSHGGSAAVDSSVGSGATFSVYLPALEGTAAPVTVSRPNSEAALNLRVLLVDDEALVRRSAGRLLRLLGCELEEAETGRVAVDRVRAATKPFDVVLMDYTMPEMDGAEASEVIRSFSPVPIILTSGYAGSTFTKPIERLTTLAKPYTLVDLRRALVEAAR